MPGVIGILLMPRTKRLFGARVSMLLGMPLSFNAPGSAVTMEKAALRMSVKSCGGLMSREPRRPIQFDARRLPRCGAQMKTTRLQRKCFAEFGGLPPADGNDRSADAGNDVAFGEIFAADAHGPWG